MPPLPLSGPALRAVVLAAESTLTADLVLALLRRDAGISELLALATDADDDVPIDQRPVPSVPTEPSP